MPTPKTVSMAMTVNDRCDAVRDLMIDSVVHQLIAPQYQYGYGHYPYARGGVALAEDKASVDAGPPMAAPGMGSGQATNTAKEPGHYTTTNVQEKGVDEGDLVKTDGKFIYTLRNGELVIAKTWPVADTELVARVAFKNLQPTALYLKGTNIIVHGVATDAPNGATRVAVIDISDRAKPKLDRTFDVDGYAASSRVVDGELYLVQTGMLQVPQKIYDKAQQELAKFPRADQQSLRPWEIQNRIAKSLRATVAASLTPGDIMAALPKIHSANGATRTMSCSDLYVPQDNVGLGITTLARISIDNQRTDLVGAMVTGGQVYASTESIFVAAPAYTWNNQGYASYQTQVHQFNLDGNDGKPAYIASGAVDGQVLNQFSMSEYGGDLRIATTDWDWNGQNGGNHLFVLRANGRALETIGSIRGLAKGERIYSGRMFGDKGYIVTFRQTDPLFTLDLSNPRAPKVAGELKINGFSNYIHPMGGDLLLAIGQDANDQGRTQGLHIQVFDVSNPAKPVRKFHEKMSSWSNYSSSIAEQDHHAFTYDPVTGTLAIPVAGQTDEGEMFNGLVVYHLDRENGFTLTGRVTHRSLANEMLDAMCAKGTNDWGCNDRTYMLGQYSQIDRSIIVDNFLLSLGTSGMEIHQLDKLRNRVARMRWPVPNAESTPELVVSRE